MSRPPPPPMSRRAALAALAGAGAAGAAACRRGWTPPEADPTSRALAKPYVPGAEAYATHEERWFHSSCGQCPAGCGIRVRVVEGRAVRVEGNRANPLNQGGIGPRGLAALQGLYDPDRLPGPRKRVGGALVPISWADALGELAEELAALRERGEPERLLVWSGEERGLMHQLWARFCGAYGTPNFVDGRPGRSGVLAQAMAATVGVAEVPSYDWEHAGIVLSLEAGLVEDSCQSVYFTRIAAELRRGAARRARLVHAGPMYDLCAHNADEWIRIRPGTGGAIALGVARLLAERHPGAALPAALVDGAEGFAALVGDFSAERVAAITGLPPARLLRLADELWAHRPALVIVDERSLAYANGLATARAALALNAVLGAFWEERGGVRLAAAPPLRDWPALEADPVAAAGLARPRLDGAAELPAATAVHESLPEAVARAGARGPAIALLHHADPAQARQQPARWRQALAAIPRVVSFSPYRDETVEAIADLVLPDHTALERWDVVIPAPALDRPIVGLRVPTVAPLHDTRATGEVVLDLARRLGGPVAAALPWLSYREAGEERLRGLFDVRRGNVSALTPSDFLHDLHAAGFWVDDRPAAGPPVRVSLPDRYEEPSWHGDPERYPLRLIVYRPLGHPEGGAQLPWLRTLRPHPGARPWWFVARVHPGSAAGLADGRRIRLESEWGAIELPLQLDERIEPGCVAVPLGGGRRIPGRSGARFGANVLDVVRPGPAPGSGADLLCATRVRLVPAGGRS
jgi:menaquinone reductase, molybdopterin-binding-like subunit